jgi:serine/threonine-protein kinase
VKKETEVPQTEEKQTEEKQTEAKQTEAPEQTLVTVPQIVGKVEDTALQMLEAQGLTGSKTGETSSLVYGAGEVILQDPAEGTEVEPGSTVTYQVSSGPEGIVLDDLTNIEKSQAQAFLLTKGLQCVMDETQYSDTVAAGCVISTQPAAGATLAEGDTVTLYISQGSEADIVYVTVPDCYYCDEDISTQRCELYGLGTPIFTYEASREVNRGFVIRQSPEAGTEVPSGTVVTFVVSTGPPSESDDTVSIDNGTGSVWECNASLDAPAGYTGQNVRIDLVQEGITTTIFTGQATFPYSLKVQGMEGVSTGTAYVYLLNDAGETESTVEYAGILFSERSN